MRRADYAEFNSGFDIPECDLPLPVLQGPPKYLYAHAYQQSAFLVSDLIEMAISAKQAAHQPNLKIAFDIEKPIKIGFLLKQGKH